MARKAWEDFKGAIDRRIKLTNMIEKRTMSKKLLGFLMVFIILLHASCYQDKKTQTLRSAYYWSTTWNMDSSKINFIQKHDIKRIYLRFFDVVKEEGGEIMPNATLQFLSPIPQNLEIVPVVYIVNDCMKPNAHIKGTDNKTAPNSLLADKILTRILQMCESNDIQQIHEIQIDCDWTATTQEAYFSFLKELREKANTKDILLSATIRLHQLSMFPPPVDKGVLMMYNTGDVKQLKSQKPILDMKDVAPYIQHLADYPLPLSAAYPLFRWHILFRGNKFVGFMHDDESFPILPGDSIVVRQPEMTDIMEAIKSINAQNEDINNEVILFDLNNQNIKRFSSEDYEKIYRH